MARAKKSYSDLQAEINKLIAQQDELKKEQLEVFLKKFKTDAFKDKVLKIDAAVLKKVAQNMYDGFDNMVANVERQVETERAKQSQVSSNSQFTNSVVSQ